MCCCCCILQEIKEVVKEEKPSGEGEKPEMAGAPAVDQMGRQPAEWKWLFCLVERVGVHSYSCYHRCNGVLWMFSSYQPEFTQPIRPARETK